jgi:hypothetical protein
MFSDCSESSSVGSHFRKALPLGKALVLGEYIRETHLVQIVRVIKSYEPRAGQHTRLHDGALGSTRLFRPKTYKGNSVRIVVKLTGNFSYLFIEIDQQANSDPAGRRLDAKGWRNSRLMRRTCRKRADGAK